MPTLEQTIMDYLGDMSRTKGTTEDIEFEEESGVTGTVSMGYVYTPPMGARFPNEKKTLFIKRIEVNGKSVVNPTLQKIFTENPQLTEIKIESIQNPGWLRSLEEKGWKIIYDDPDNPNSTIHALKTRGGRRKTRRNKRNKRKSKRRT